MRIPQLEADLRAKKDQLRALVETTMRACQEHVTRAATATEPAITGRMMTDEERAAIKALQDECRTLQGRIERSQGDADLVAEIERMTGGPSRPAGLARPTSSDRRSIGQRFAASPEFVEFLHTGGHRRSGAWTSPAIEADHWRTAEMFATTLTEDPASGGSLITPQYLPGLLALPTRRVVVADLAAPGTTNSNLVIFTREKTFTNAADAVKEAAAKPESALVFEPANAPVRKIAHWIPVSEEMLEDEPQTASIIDARLRYGIELKEEDELLNGSGTDPHLLGYNTMSGKQAALPVGTDTIMDAMLKQMTAIAINSLITPDGFVMNPANWLSVQIAKNTMGNYMGGGPWTAPQAPMLWGIPGAITPAQVAGTALIGAFRQASQIFRRGGVRVEATNSHQDFFIKNLVAIRGEERLALAVYRPGAFGQVTGATTMAVAAAEETEPHANHGSKAHR